MKPIYKSIILAISLFFALSVSISAAPGDLDPTFGNGGKVTTDLPGAADAVVLQPDGKVIVAGFIINADSPAFLIVRYNGDGSLDTSFGNGGMVVTDFGAQDFAQAVVLQPDGKIVVTGYSQSQNITNSVLARYNADGNLDSTFGNGGKVITGINGQSKLAYALVLQADGKMVTAGFACVPLVRCSSELIRYNSNGSLDSTFGTGGIVTANFGGQADWAGALVLQADGKIVVAGGASSATNSDLALARYNSNGTLDTTFGTGGKVTTDFGALEGASQVVIQPDGKILAAGSIDDHDFDTSPYGFVLARYHADGSLDTAFGSGGKVITTEVGSGLSGLALQADGKVVTAGYESFVLVRYTANGTLDTTFGAGGIVTTGFNPYASASGGIVIQPEGKIVAAGSSGSGIALARYVVDAPCPNPIDCNEFFVRQHYLDFLGREPDPAGFAGWLNILNNCGITVPQPCDRIEVSSAFFRSPEFQGRGYFIYRFYPTIAKVPIHSEFMPDFAKVSGFLTDQQLEAAKASFVLEFMARTEFQNRYASTFSSPSAYVDALLQTVGLPNHPARQTWINQLNANNTTQTRGDVLRALVESTEMYQKFYNEAFVVMQYFGYLRRTADAAYLDWIQTMNQNGGDYRLMINGFVNSIEYRQRFGS